MTLVNTGTGEVAPVSPEESAAVERLNVIISALTETVDSLPVSEVAALKAQVVTIQTATRELNMSREAQDLAAEAVRRFEWRLGRAIRHGQEHGSIARQGYPLTRMADEGGEAAVIPAARVSDFVTKNEWRGELGIAALADIDADDFDAALAEAKAEGNLSRANVARKAAEKAGRPVGPASAGSTERAHQEAELVNSLTGTVRFAVSALASILRSNNGQGAPNDLRFQCRIAQDARKNFEQIPIPGGGHLSVHPKSKPQFGRDRNGKPYLTVVLVDSRDGESYKVRWLGDAVPRKMQEVAVKHDEGKRVAATRVALRWQDAEIVPSEHIERERGRKDLDAEGNPRVRPDGSTGGKTKRAFDRLCATDLVPADDDAA